MRRPQALGERAIRWVETWCRTPDGRPVQLTFEQRCVVHELFAGGLQPAEVAGPLAAYLVLFSLAGPEARTGAPAPQFTIDVFTLWNAAGPELRAYLRRRGETIVCPELGTAGRERHDHENLLRPADGSRPFRPRNFVPVPARDPRMVPAADLPASRFPQSYGIEEERGALKGALRGDFNEVTQGENAAQVALRAIRA